MMTDRKKPLPIVFEETKNGFECSRMIKYNDQDINGHFMIRKTRSLDMWVLEYYKDGVIFLPAQKVYEDEKTCMSYATECIRKGITGMEGKWTYDVNSEPSGKMTYSVERMPKSNINWR